MVVRLPWVAPITDGGNFNWNNGQISAIKHARPNLSWFGLHETSGPAAYCQTRVQLMRDLRCFTSSTK